jgi:hypothetical protein
MGACTGSARSLAGPKCLFALFATPTNRAFPPHLADTKREVGVALAECERAHLEAVAAAWELLVGLVGYRLREVTC